MAKKSKPKEPLSFTITGLLSPFMKTERAAAHLQELQALCGRFKANPYTITEHDDFERSLHIVTIHLRDMNALVPLLIGEWAHSLRSSLDHLVWQLQLLSGREPSRSSGFPIHTSESREDRERFMRQTWSAPCEAIEIIKALQPYQRGNAFKTHPLWQLNKLANLDKHVTVGYAGTRVQSRPIMFRGAPSPACVIDKDTHEVRYLIPLVHKADVKIEPLPPILEFGRPIDAAGTPFRLQEADIAEIQRFVRFDVLPRFKHFFSITPAHPDLPDDLRA